MRPTAARSCWRPSAPGLLILTVEDSGPGVPPEMADRLFEPFVTGRPEGTGLGLAIARELTDAHGGRLVLRSSGRSGRGGVRGGTAPGGLHGHHPDRRRRRRPAPGARDRADRPRPSGGGGRRTAKRPWPGCRATRRMPCCWTCACRAWTAWMCCGASGRSPAARPWPC